MVTPYMMSVLAMVRLLCDTIMNWDWPENFRMMLLNLSMLVSSNGASTSSKIQNGAGFRRYRENSRAVAVNVFSPPESWLIDNGRFPFGLAMISISDSSGLVGSDRIRSQVSSSLNNDRNTVMKFSRTRVNASMNFSRAVSSISWMVSSNEFFASIKSCFSLMINV